MGLLGVVIVKIGWGQWKAVESDTGDGSGQGRAFADRVLTGHIKAVCVTHRHTDTVQARLEP